MKIINSHYIPMPEPRWLIVTPEGEIYEQLGTLSVVGESSTKKSKYGITTHNHPVVAFAVTGYIEETEDSINVSDTITIANGFVLDDVLTDDCSRLCLENHRAVSLVKYNLLALKLLRDNGYENFKMEKLQETFKSCSIKVRFPEEEMHDIELTLSSDEDLGLLFSDMSDLFFAVPCWAYADKDGVHIEDDKILMEFVNQARTYLKINHKYRFHFHTSIEALQPLIDKINNELEDYLDRK